MIWILSFDYEIFDLDLFWCWLQRNMECDREYLHRGFPGNNSRVRSEEALQ